MVPTVARRGAGGEMKLLTHLILLALLVGVDALLQEVHLANEVNRVRLAYHGDVEGTATAAQEFVLARVRHTAGVGGRSDMIVTSGDVPAGQALVINQCWNAGLQQTYRIVRNCPLEWHWRC